MSSGRWEGEKGIRHTTTKPHAAVVETQKIAIGDMLSKGMEDSEDKDWTGHLGYALLTSTR